MRIIRKLYKASLKILYRIEVRGTDVIAEASSTTPVLLIANQASFIDFLLLDLFLPFDGPVFISRQLQATGWLSFFLKIVHCQLLDPDNPGSVAQARKLITSKTCLIFSAESVATSSSLGKIDATVADLCRQRKLRILPVHIDGSDRGVVISRLCNTRLRFFPKITISLDKPCKLSGMVRGLDKDRLRAITRQQLFSMLENASFAACNYQRNIFAALVEAARLHGRKRIIVEDSILPAPFSYGRLILASMILGKKLHEHAQGETRIGVLLPNSTSTVITFFALQAWGITPVMLNASAGFATLAAAIRTAGIQLIITSRRFIKLGQFDELTGRLEEQVRFVYLEEIRSSLSRIDKVRGIIASRFPLLAQSRYLRDADDEAVVLFTSGSESQPKGVVLSSANLLANAHQSAIRFALYRNDLLLNCLPVFHCFGLTVGTLLPLLAGVRVYMYPSPLHYDLIPEIIYNRQVTFFLGTDTFYNGYARKADACDFGSLRYAVAGAEKLRESTRRLFSDRFGTRIIEGYGATEASPVISCNNAIYNAQGSVGRLLSGMEYRLKKVKGIECGSKLFLRGPNIMRGYIDPADPHSLEKTGQWYDTGDMVTLDDQGFITIVGRHKRFIKIAGEMLSLQRLEYLAEKFSPDYSHAALAVASADRGETIVLLTDCKNLDRMLLAKHIRQAGESSLMIPQSIVYQQQIPLLASGKIDYPEALRLVQTVISVQ